MQRVFKIKGRYPWSALEILLGIMVLVFTIDRVSLVWFGNNFLGKYLPLSIYGLKEGKLWQLLTYMFMHDGIWHIFCNAIVLFFIGKLIEQKYGRNRLLGVFFLSGLVGAIVWFLIHRGQFYGVLLGASAGCLGLFSYFCLICENRPMTFLLFFVIPVRLKPRILLAITTGLELYCLLIQELTNGHVANSAHLGGILGGCICYFFYQYRHKYMYIIKENIKHKSQTKHTVCRDNYKLYITSHSAKRKEVDRILDKINEYGFKSLSESEKNTLNAAKHLMHR